MVNKRNKRKKEPVILAIFAIAMIIFSSTAAVITAPDEEESLGEPFQYPDLPRKETTPDYFLVKEPAITMEGARAMIEFQTIVPAPRAKVYFGLYVPDQEIKIPQYRRESIEDLLGESTSHTVTLKISKFENPKYDLCNFAEKGGVVCYRIELYNPAKATAAFYDGRFRVDGDYNLMPCVTEGPFVDMVTTTGAVISWDASDETTGAVEVDGLLYIDGKSATYHEITVDGLTPNTKYDYDVFVDGVQDFKTYHFKTAPSTNAGFEFAALSDSRQGVGGGERSFGGVNYQRLSQFMIDAYNRGADFVLFGGDLINGYTTNVTDFRMQLESWKDASEQVGCYIPIYEGMGNHEALIDVYDDGSKYGISFDKVDDETTGSKSAERVFAEEFVNPHNGPEVETAMKSTAPIYDENVYYFDYANTRIVSFNTNYGWCSNPEEHGGNLEGYVMDDQLEWIKGVLANAAANPEINHVFMFAHEPAFPNGGHLGDAQWYSGKKPYVVDRRDELWEAISQNGKVVAVFFGDEHNYHRTLINKDTPVYLDGTSNLDFVNPVWQIVSGGAGAPFYAQQETPWSDFVGSFYPSKHYCMIQVNGDKVTLKVISDSREIVDEVVLRS